MESVKPIVEKGPVVCAVSFGGHFATVLLTKVRLDGNSATQNTAIVVDSTFNTCLEDGLVFTLAKKVFG